MMQSSIVSFYEEENSKGIATHIIVRSRCRIYFPSKPSHDIRDGGWVQKDEEVTKGVCFLIFSFSFAHTSELAVCSLQPESGSCFLLLLLWLIIAWYGRAILGVSVLESR